VAAKSYRLGAFTLDLARREMHRGEMRLDLPAKVFDCITYLVEHRDRAVGRDELIAAVWGRVDVSDNLLAQVILRARRSFDDDAGEQRAIRTITGFGYRWVTACEEVSDEALTPPFEAPTPTPTTFANPPPPAPPRSFRPWKIAAAAVLAAAIVACGYLLLRDRSGRPPPTASIAVLPLTNAGGSDEQYFSDGISEELIIALTRFGNLKVIGPSSAFQFRDSKDDPRTIGAKLGVTHLLEGSVGRTGDVVRVRTELIDVADGSTIWSEHYDRPYKDLFALQDEITSSVANALRAKLFDGDMAAVQSDRPPSGKLEAYTAYLQGRFYHLRYTETDLHKALEQYTAATQVDPGYAQAWSAIALCWTDLARVFLNGEAAQQAYEEARTAANTALTLAPNLAIGHDAHGFLLEVADFDWHGAEAEYRRAMQLWPGSMHARFDLSILLSTLGQVDHAVDLLHQALANDPLRPTWRAWMALYLRQLGRLDEAEQMIRKAIELQPGASSFRAELTAILIDRGEASAALAAAREEPPGVWHEVAVALALQIGKDRAAADASLQSMIESYSQKTPFQIARIYALRRDPDQLFVWLEKAWTQRDAAVSGLMRDSIVGRYRNDPRFGTFARKIGVIRANSGT
jgi:TolB-like protein/DNA-binding winged helix-turn-helix (wHTH) protein/Tfp pilus assembly protein PilF